MGPLPRPLEDQFHKQKSTAGVYLTPPPETTNDLKCDMSYDTLLPTPCSLDTAVSTMPIAVLVASLAVGSDGLRLLHDYGIHLLRPRHEYITPGEEALYELAAQQVRVTYICNGPGSFEDRIG